MTQYKSLIDTIQEFSSLIRYKWTLVFPILRSPSACLPRTLANSCPRSKMDIDSSIAVIDIVIRSYAPRAI